jgi:hypothetical protein
MRSPSTVILNFDKPSYNGGVTWARVAARVGAQACIHCKLPNAWTERAAHQCAPRGAAWLNHETGG